ncbi:bacteriocin family protein [Irregularibacter muris]|jgi:uncharacterized linocin/CFP29 family protein|uniref:Type 1 encapsulin shell protein n=1 Tax=Irregularibacter muris TaxID=1796619 RepID=A0AAE3HDY6_9FIRM|nr:family 1 encapsulin nanocompartment shell protein [Irregularibacter muris]MCR1898331.1 bacteriocin family protein [Irregularibacter muris]
MDILKRGLAPISAEAWSEIDEKAAEVLKSRLSARKAVKVDGPKGWDYTVIPEGRLILKEDEKDVKTGVFQVKPLVEARASFTLNRWEMDNVARGARDIDLDNLEEAVRKIAEFEENAVYKGYEAGNIQGLDQSTAHNIIPFGNDDQAIMDALSEGVVTLKEHYVEEAFTLIVGKEAYKRLHKKSQGYPLVKRIESLLGGKVLYSTVVEGAYLIPYNHDDLEFTIGQDFSIGYEGHDDKEVRLFITETFTFRVLDENIIIKYRV